MNKYVLILLSIMFISPVIASAQSVDVLEKPKDTKQTELNVTDLDDYQLKENYEVVYDREFLTAGKDIPIGKYRAVSEKNGYVFDLDAEQNATNSLLVAKWSYVELKENQSIRLKDVFLTPITKDMPPVVKGDVIADGVYLIGTDIESGKYNILSIEMESSLAVFDSFNVNDFSNATFPPLSESTLVLKDGQILSVGKVELSK